MSVTVALAFSPITTYTHKTSRIWHYVVFPSVNLGLDGVNEYTKCILLLAMMQCSGLYHN